MGVQGLLPFVKSASKPVNVKEFKGCTVAVDAYCWLYKGAFSCAERLVKGEKTDGYVAYVMKMASMLISAGIRPILVFDGQSLPSKKLTEEKRREKREVNKKKAKQLLAEGKIYEARQCYQQALDITPDMALEVIQACRSRKIDYLVAPYEADAQLAYLNKAGIADIVITEDSDLIVFGCEKIIFKMDQGGYGILVEKSRLVTCFGNGVGNFTHDKFRQMCILSGCDYLPSLPGIGLARACKFLKLITHSDLRVQWKKSSLDTFKALVAAAWTFSTVSKTVSFEALPTMPAYLKMPRLSVSEAYIEGFFKAENTFLYQLVFCPGSNKLVPLHPYPPDINPEELTYAGRWLPDEEAFQIAIGNINVTNQEKMDFYIPPERKVLRDHSSTPEKTQVRERKELSAVESVAKNPRVGPPAAKSPVKRTHSLPRKEQKEPEKTEILEASSLSCGRPVPDEDGAPDTVPPPSPMPSSPHAKMFKVASKPPASRSRFLSPPPKCSERKEAEDKPQSVVEALEDYWDSPRGREYKRYLDTKIEWQCSTFGNTPVIPDLWSFISMPATSRKLRTSVPHTSPNEGALEENSDPVSQKAGKNQRNTDIQPFEVGSGSGTVKDNPDNEWSLSTAEKENARTRIRNPFAKSLRLTSSSTLTNRSEKKVDPISENEYLLTNPVPMKVSTLPMEGCVPKGDVSHEFEKESRETYPASNPDEAVSTEQNVCEASLDSCDTRAGCEKSDEYKTPEKISFGKGSARAPTPWRPAKKALSKTRRLSLPKTKPKEGLYQLSITEAFDKNKFKRNRSTLITSID